MFKLSPELKARGEKAETDFRNWLNRSMVAFMYVEQSPLTVPNGLRGRIKRPDYLVGVPHAGMLSFDVKAKTLYDGCLIFDVAELKKQQRFARLFNLTTYLACLDLDHEGRFWWIELTDILQARMEWRGKRQVAMINIEEVFTVDMGRQTFIDALMNYTANVMDT